MINKRLIGTVPDSKKYIAANVLCQWLALLANIVLMAAVARLLAGLWQNTVEPRSLAALGAVGAAARGGGVVVTPQAPPKSEQSTQTGKNTKREKKNPQLLRLGSSYKEQVNTSEVVQVAVEGVDQLETYFGAYLPQFFYAMLAPLTLFGVLAFVSLPAALVLLVCVPLIPAAIVAVQRWAKKLLAKYWGQYTALGDSFLENLQGLTTLKIYQADEYKQQEMDRQAEQFRRITMKVLTMQLNSITIMDLIAYGGAALGAILAATQFAAGHISLDGALLILLLAADFFIPMRLLGSFFHIAMNGMAASDKIFRLLDLPEPAQGTETLGDDLTIRCRDLSFGYQPEKPVLRGLELEIPMGSFTALVGESGCGKSTLSAILMGRNKGYTGSVTVGGLELRNIREDSLLGAFTYVSHQSYLFKGTVADNLRMARPDASDAALWQVLEQVKLADFVRSEQGLNTPVAERGSNLSGGQCQRLALARALLADSPAYIFDEATSNIDVESENDIMEVIRRLAKTKTVLLISHRLANVEFADNIYVLEKGRLAESGSHSVLLARGGCYARLWNAQAELENYGKEGAAV